MHAIKCNSIYTGNYAAVCKIQIGKFANISIN